MIANHSPEKRVTRSHSRLSNEPPPTNSSSSIPSVSRSNKPRKRKNMSAKIDLQAPVPVPAAASTFSTIHMKSNLNGNVVVEDSKSSSKTSPIKPRLPSSASFERIRQLEDEEAQRKKIVLWRKPLRTVYYFFMELICLIREFGFRFWRCNLLLPCALIATLIVIVYNIPGPHQTYVDVMEREVIRCLYWVGLGVLSSIGLGTGLHTFLLYLGPFIASVTLAAYECATLAFPQPPYPDEILCPEGVTIDAEFQPSLWNIMSKVRLESFMWGLGTAIGELPPYFMARAARLSGKESEELIELQALLEDKKENLPLTITERAKIFMEQLVFRVGFFGILLGASIPNPLFDLAGITCGHFLVPFSTFFGATLLGKAVIKMHIQMIFVIITFSERHVEHIVKLLTHIPRVGPYLVQPFVEFLQKQKENLHRRPGSSVHHAEPSWLQWGFEKLVIGMVIYFVLSIVNSLAQNYHRRIMTTSLNAVSIQQQQQLIRPTKAKAKGK